MTTAGRIVFIGSGAGVALVAHLTGWSNLPMMVGWALGVLTVSVADWLDGRNE